MDTNNFPKIGQIWTFIVDDKNPFAEIFYAYIIDVKNEYVQYTLINPEKFSYEDYKKYVFTGLKWSHSIKYFTGMYKFHKSSLEELYGELEQPKRIIESIYSK